MSPSKTAPAQGAEQVIGKAGKAEAPACLIDASIYIFRYYFSLPDNWFSAQGYPTAAVYGYTSFLINLLSTQQPKVVAACYDESLGSCFRNELYPDYKSSRALPDEALAFQLEACRRVSELLGIASFGSDLYEADDLLGSLVRVLRRSRRPIAVISRDKDLGQLIRRAQDFLWHPDFNHSHDGERSYRDDIAAKFGVQPEQLTDYLALVGDKVDDIPGVPGLGPKTAQALLQAYGDLRTIFANIEQLHTLPIRGAKSLGDKLVAHTEQIALSQQLAIIVDDIPLGVKTADLHWREPDRKALADFCREMGFERLMSRVDQLVAEHSAQ